MPFSEYDPELIKLSCSTNGFDIATTICGALGGNSLTIPVVINAGADGIYFISHHWRAF